MKIISIVLAEDHAVVRQALKVLLEGDPTFEIVGEAADGLETVAMVDELRPDVLLLDLIMPGLNGLEVARQVTQRSPEVRIVVLSMHSDEEYVLEALGHGVMGYILKDSGASELVDAIKCVRRASAISAPGSMNGPSSTTPKAPVLSRCGPMTGSPTASARCCSYRPKAKASPRSAGCF